MSAAVWRQDNPWRRLAWTLPLALILAALWLGLFATLLSLGRPPEPQPQPAIEAQLVTLPPPAAPTPPAPAPPAPPQPAETKPSPPMPMPPPPVKRSPPPRPSAPARETSAPPKPEMPPAAVPPSPAPAQPNHPLAAGQMGARAIYKPMPQIPDELRRESFQSVAVARFHVAVDGSAEVELVQPTNNVALNRLLLDTFKTWRFFPAMQNGHPVPSTIEIRVPISIQ